MSGEEDADDQSENDGGWQQPQSDKPNIKIVIKDELMKDIQDCVTNLPPQNNFEQYLSRISDDQTQPAQEPKKKRKKNKKKKADLPMEVV